MKLNRFWFSGNQPLSNLVYFMREMLHLPLIEADASKPSATLLGIFC